LARSAKFLSPMSNVLFFHLHGAAARVDPDATAFGLRDDQWDYDVISQWTDPAETTDHIKWTRDFWTAVEPFSTGEVYVNHLDADEATRAGAREALAQLAQPIATTAPMMPATSPMPGAPAMPAAPHVPTTLAMPTVPLPSSPIAMAARALRALPPEQLLDIALQRLRAALPAGTTVAAPKGIQFQLVPAVPPPSGSR